MNDEKRRPGRPATKHLHDDHHFKAVGEQEPVEVTENPIVQNVEKDLEAECAVSITEEISVTPVTISPLESPVETISLNGWKPMETEVVLNTPPRNGIPIKVAETVQDSGIIVFWKRLRAFANATKRWQETGAWIDFHTGMKISFEPKYWKARF